MSIWLMKSEPTEYSIDHLERDGSSSWYGVRNYQARNFMRDSVKIGDLVLFYHSNGINNDFLIFLEMILRYYNLFVHILFFQK